MIILGSGMAGCLAGALNPKATIIEASSQIPNHHKAVLRFRDDKISRALGVDFKEVNVRKTIWLDEKEATPSPRMSNLYSQKVTGKIIDRSINNLDAVTRYIAPSDFHLILGDMCHGRISFGEKVIGFQGASIHTNKNVYVPIEKRQPVISTMPMPVLLNVLGINHNQDFKHAPIFVARFEIPNCDVHQTIYYPSLDFDVYRATLTGNQLIVESTGIISNIELLVVAESFGITINFDNKVGIETEQQYGKIAPIDDKWRKEMIFSISQKYGIYSLGRFATWKNILLDDVYDDIYVIKRLLNKGMYDSQLEEVK